MLLIKTVLLSHLIGLLSCYKNVIVTVNIPQKREQYPVTNKTLVIKFKMVKTEFNCFQLVIRQSLAILGVEICQVSHDLVCLFFLQLLKRIYNYL